MYIMCVCLFSALSRRVGALQMSIIIIVIMSVFQSEKIRTVIKTKSLWGPQNIKGSMKAVYTVNKKKHLLSLLTMIGPSPDWCLGESLRRFCCRF